MTYQVNETAPVLFVTFNRPDLAEQVFSEIKKAQPKRLYFASDGPRDSNTDDDNKIQELRLMVHNGIDWPCELKTLELPENLGLPNANLNAITWFFEHEDAGIILEDDTVPTQSFFRYCSELLSKHRNDTRIMHVCGFNAFENLGINKQPYYFSNYGHLSGWATWRRAWKKLDRNLDSWKEVRQLNVHKDSPLSVMRQQFETAWSGKNKSGLIRWYYSVAVNSGLYILPDKSLVKNIGFRGDGTNFTDVCHPYGLIERNELKFPMNEPCAVVTNDIYEQARIKEKTYIARRGFKRYIKIFLNKILKK